MSNMYFWHPSYDDYPVVGVTWQQANAFNVWRTQLLNSWRNKQWESYVQDFRLPTEAEWEYAARGGLDLSPYPWGGPYIRNARGCFLGNFKPMRGRYMEDGGFHTVKVTSYHPNDYGLYCMAGNVAEWCSTAYDESVYEFAHDLNTEYKYNALDHDPPSMKRKVIRGIKRISTPGCREYVSVDKLPRVLNGMGISIVSTSKGVMSNKKAKNLNIGGEILCQVW
jgi:gliding motility-associated lipoprotein GldK